MALYDELGGSAAVTAAVDLFYGRVLTDPMLVPYFDGIDVPKLKGHQRAFITAALGGPHAYAGRSMADAHRGFAITPSAFGAAVGHLADTLAELGVDEETIGVIATTLAPLQDDIVTADEPAA